MNKLLFRSLDEHSAKGKPRVYFTCHPADLESTLDPICGDILSTHNCIIYYREDPSETLPEDNRETDLMSMNLFVIPVTEKLLTEPSVAADEDLGFAVSNGIRLLPICTEDISDCLNEYSRLFGTMQYLDRSVSDDTAVDYRKKLKDFLDSTLLDDKTAELIRSQFDTYIFLSYRKKDRRSANKLMRQIHRNRHFISLAVWYDEFLVPGEKFDESISKAMDSSKLFMLLVTPSLLEKDDFGEKNYIQRIEYPRARELELPVLPVELIKADRELLEKDFIGLPVIVSADDEDQLYCVLTESVSGCISDLSGCAERLYYLGLAYLNGCDVEVDRDLGIELLTSAGEAGHIGAIEKLIDIYTYTVGVPRFSARNVLNNKAVYWMRKQYEYYKDTFGEGDGRTLKLLFNLTEKDGSLKAEQKKEMIGKCLSLGKKVFEEDDPFMIDVLYRSAYHAESPEERIRTQERAFILAYKRFGSEKGSPAVQKYDLFRRYLTLPDKKIFKVPVWFPKMLEECLENRRRLFGENDRYTKELIRLTARISSEEENEKPSDPPDPSGQANKPSVEELHSKYRKYVDSKQYSAAEHFLNKLLFACAETGDLRLRRQMLEEAREDHRACFTEENMPPSAQNLLKELATVCFRLGDIRSAEKYLREAYVIFVKQNGEEEHSGSGWRFSKHSFEEINWDGELEEQLAGLYDMLEEYDNETDMLIRLFAKTEKKVRILEKAKSPEQYDIFLRRTDFYMIAGAVYKVCCKCGSLSRVTDSLKTVPELPMLLLKHAGFFVFRSRNDKVQAQIRSRGEFCLRHRSAR